jgi:hypothetical protein
MRDAFAFPLNSLVKGALRTGGTGDRLTTTEVDVGLGDMSSLPVIGLGLLYIVVCITLPFFGFLWERVKKKGGGV